VDKDAANKILYSIGQSFLTEQEAAEFSPPLTSAADFYKKLSDVVIARGSEGDAVMRLNAYAASQGVSLNAEPTRTSNLLFCGGL
jgi:hypothetical protein